MDDKKYVLKIEFPNEELANEFATYMSDAGGEQRFLDYLDEDLGIKAYFLYHADNQFLGDETIRLKIFSQRKSNSENKQS